MEPTPTYTRLLPVSAMFLVGAAAIGFVFDLMFLGYTADGAVMTILGIFGILPFAFVVGAIQDFAIQIRQGKIPFFTNQSAQELFATNAFLLLIAVLLVGITIAVMQVDASIEMNWWRYMLLMGISYFATWCIRTYRKNYLHQ